jgi:hypothetical protein
MKQYELYVRKGEEIMLELPEALDPFGLHADTTDPKLFNKKRKDTGKHQALNKCYASSYLSAYIQIYITLWCLREEELVQSNAENQTIRK